MGYNPLWRHHNGNQKFIPWVIFTAYESYHVIDIHYNVFKANQCVPTLYLLILTAYFVANLGSYFLLKVNILLKQALSNAREILWIDIELYTSISDLKYGKNFSTTYWRDQAVFLCKLWHTSHKPSWTDFNKIYRW